MNPLDSTEAFTYLSITFTYNNSDWASLYANLVKAQKLWGMVAKVLIQPVAHVKERSMLYNAVVQMVLLYG